MLFLLRIRLIRCIMFADSIFLFGIFFEWTNSHFSYHHLHIFLHAFKMSHVFYDDIFFLKLLCLLMQTISIKTYIPNVFVVSLWFAIYPRFLISFPWVIHIFLFFFILIITITQLYFNFVRSSSMKNSMNGIKKTTIRTNNS